MIVFTAHAELRIKTFNLLKDDVIRVLNNPDMILYDTLTGNLIAIGYIRGRILIVVYIKNITVKVITVLLTSKRNIIRNRIARGRWIRIK